MTPRALELLARIEAGAFALTGPSGVAVFFAADSGRNRLRMQTISEAMAAEGQKPTRIGATALGREMAALDGDNSIPPDDMLALWAQASRAFAAAPHAAALAFVVDAHPRSIFRAVEFPELLHNPAVSVINGVARAELAALHAVDPDCAFNRVAAAQIGLSESFAADVRVAFALQLSRQGRSEKLAFVALEDWRRAFLLRSAVMAHRKWAMADSDRAEDDLGQFAFGQDLTNLSWL
jgi:hypothetical protein